MIKRYRRPTVQLTSLLDLLFCMIFVSLLQSKTPVTPEAAAPSPKTPPPVEKKAPVKTFTVNAIFHFYATNRNPEVPTGTYAMAGTFDKEKRLLALGGVSWINRPEGFDMVPLNGVISSDGKRFRGKIEFQGCEEFVLQKTRTFGESPFAGKWEGKYVCSQGETGLTLTLQGQ